MQKYSVNVKCPWSSSTQLRGVYLPHGRAQCENTTTFEHDLLHSDYIDFEQSRNLNNKTNYEIFYKDNNIKQYQSTQRSFNRC
eukprot:455388-Amphidinium_carterae.1